MISETERIAGKLPLTDRENPGLANLWVSPAGLPNDEIEEPSLGR